MTEATRHWVVIPAAGVGRRVGALIPKQYLELAGRRVIDHTLAVFVQHPSIAGVVVAVDGSDPHWPETEFADHPTVQRCDGGVERCHSVLNALDALSRQASDQDWVLVHDAARPCLRREDLDRLLERVEIDPVGGILAVPVRDTMKRADGTRHIVKTESRDGLWHAFTPQMFRFCLLRRVLRQAIEQDLVVTDDASAIELAGLTPLLVEGHADNIKITRPEDLPLAQFHLTQQGRL